MVHIQLHEEEIEALHAFAGRLGQTPSRIIRRLLREALTGGPDYFKDELGGVDRMSRELAAIGRNLNQIAKAANRGERVEVGEFKRVANATRLETAALQARFDQAITSVIQRTARALSGQGEEAGPGGRGA